MKLKLKLILFVIFLLVATILIGSSRNSPKTVVKRFLETSQYSSSEPYLPKWIPIRDTIRIGGYFKFMDSLVIAYDTLTDYPLSEHLLVRANPWIIDTLANTDYYRMMARDSFVYDQKQLIVLHPTDSLWLPGLSVASQLMDNIRNTHIDVNIPEFKLRIYEDSILLHTFPVRVGQNKKQYLKMGDRITDLRTESGIGKIVGYSRNPAFYNPVDGKRYYLTKRDDQKTTLMPQIPWIETEINGIRYGHMIHPTTNPISLGKASSNGCIGTRESDAWIIYYYAAIGTRLHIRYNLNILDEEGNEKVLKNIYNK